MPAHKRIDAGLARSFQIVSVFTNLTVFETVRVAAQARSPYRASLWRDAYRLPDVCEKAWTLLATVGLAERARELCAPIWRMANNGCSKLRWRWRPTRNCCCWTNRLAGLGDADRERIGTLIRKLSRSHTVLLIEHDIDRVLAALRSDHRPAPGPCDRGGRTCRHRQRSEGAGSLSWPAWHAGASSRSRPAVPRSSVRPLLTLSGVDAGYNASRNPA